MDTQQMIKFGFQATTRGVFLFLMIIIYIASSLNRVTFMVVCCRSWAITSEDILRIFSDMGGWLHSIFWATIASFPRRRANISNLLKPKPGRTSKDILHIGNVYGRIENWDTPATFPPFPGGNGFIFAILADLGHPRPSIQRAHICMLRIPQDRLFKHKGGRPGRLLQNAQNLSKPAAYPLDQYGAWALQAALHLSPTMATTERPSRRGQNGNHDTPVRLPADLFVLPRGCPGRLSSVLCVGNERSCPGRSTPPRPASPRPASPRPAWPRPAPSRLAPLCPTLPVGYTGFGFDRSMLLGRGGIAIVSLLLLLGWRNSVFSTKFQNHRL